MKLRPQKDTILYGDCRNTIPTIHERVQMCVTSPPYYGLRDYGGESSQIGQEQTPEEYIENLVNEFSDFARMPKPIYKQNNLNDKARVFFKFLRKK